MALFRSNSLFKRLLALGGVWEGDFTAKNLSVQWREGVRCLGMNQAEKLQFVDVKVADGLHYWKLRDHLEGKKTR